ncbi:putative protein phosphatase CG10417 [Haematobia irritans]|uniref:putative protein phosphatase CG10417 n=1 Tax=Haematobia irritans TaxID=7368 RepID=UPI003F4FF2E0
MGAYLSQPKTDKLSTDEINNYLIVGASSMQGWRNSQEDAHNAILDFDKNTAFFAVYDGHGGAEVSTYCADKLPGFLKALEAYKNGNFEQALKDAFLGFDKTLLEPAVIEILKVLAGEKNFVDGEDSDAMDDDDEDLAELHEEGSLPLDEVMEKYKGHPSMPSLKKLKESGNGGSKPQSPYLRGRRAAAVIADAANRAELDPDSKPEGSSTSKAALAAIQDEGPSSSKSSSSSQVANKMETEEDSTVSSSSSSASKTNNSNDSNKNEADAQPSSSKQSNGKATLSPDSSAVKENEQNGNVSSTDKKTETAASEVSGSEVATSGNEGQKQNGNVESSTKSPSKIETSNASAISSTSKEQKLKNDINFDVEDSNDEEDFDDDEEDLGEESTEDEDADYDDDDVEDEDEEGDDDEEDEESYLANEQFCANMIEEPGKDSGCTAVVGLLHGRDLYVANAGDSRCVVCRNGKAIEMSLDHKPEDDEESARIIKAGGRVTLDGRVNGGLNLSRALGDHAYKMTPNLPAEEQMISALPDIKKLIITPEDEFMVLACDGIWNYMTSEEVVEFVRLRLKDETKKMSEICEELFDACLAPNTLGDGTGCDNMTAVIVRFKPSVLELPTKIDPKTTEDVLLLAKQSEVDESSPLKAQKRSASPTSDESNEAENQTKRLKTDNNEKDGDSTSASSSIGSTTAANKTSGDSASCVASSAGDDAKMKEDESSSTVESST